MTSPARRHWQKMTATTAGANARTRQASGDQHDLMMAQLWADRRQLSDIKSVERKIVAKRADLLPHYDDYVAGVLASGIGAQDEVLMTAMIWRFDVGDLAGALEIADYAVAHNLNAPDRFERDTASLIAERTAEEALDQITEDADQADPIVGAWLAQKCQHAWQLVGQADMHDQITAKLEKAWGYALRAQGERDPSALEHLRNALAKNSKIGVKKDIERLERQIKNADADAHSATQNSGKQPTG